MPDLGQLFLHGNSKIDRRQSCRHEDGEQVQRLDHGRQRHQGDAARCGGHDPARAPHRPQPFDAPCLLERTLEVRAGQARIGEDQVTQLVERDAVSRVECQRPPQVANRSRFLLEPGFTVPTQGFAGCVVFPRSKLPPAVRLVESGQDALAGLEQLASAAVALGRVESCGLLAHCVPFLGDETPARAHGGRSSHTTNRGLHELVLGFASMQLLMGENLEQQHTQGVDIGPAVDQVRAPHDLLRCHVPRGPILGWGTLWADPEWVIVQGHVG